MWFYCFRHRLEELQLVGQVEAAVVRFARDDTVPVKIAAATAVGDLVTCQLSASGGSSSSSLEALVSPLVGLLGPDQPSEVQRAGMQVPLNLTLWYAVSLDQFVAKPAALPIPVLRIPFMITVASNSSKLSPSHRLWSNLI